MPRHGRMTTERAKDFKGTLRQLLAAMSKYKLSLVVVIVFAVLSTIFNIAGPKILAKATTALATGWIAKLRGVGGIDFAYIGKVLLFLLGMYLLSAAFSFIQGWLMSGLSQKVCYDFRDQISKKINRLPLAYFEKRTVGEVLSRITNDVDTLGQSLNQSVTQLITSVATMVGVLIMMLSISPKMTLIALLILPVSLALVLVVVKFSQKYFKAQQATLGVVNGQVEEVYSGHNVIKAFNREAAVLDDFNDANDKLYESAWKSQFLSGLMQPIMNFVGNLGYVAVAIVGRPKNSPCAFPADIKRWVRINAASVLPAPVTSSRINSSGPGWLISSSSTAFWSGVGCWIKGNNVSIPVNGATAAAGGKTFTACSASAFACRQ